MQDRIHLKINRQANGGLTITGVLTHETLFEIAPADGDQLDDGPVWARLSTQAVGRQADPVWDGRLGEFVPTASDHAGVPV